MTSRRPACGHTSQPKAGPVGSISGCHWTPRAGQADPSHSTASTTPSSAGAVTRQPARCSRSPGGAASSPRRAGRAGSHTDPGVVLIGCASRGARAVGQAAGQARPGRRRTHREDGARPASRRAAAAGSCGDRRPVRSGRRHARRRRRRRATGRGRRRRRAPARRARRAPGGRRPAAAAPVARRRRSRGRRTTAGCRAPASSPNGLRTTYDAPAIPMTGPGSSVHVATTTAVTARAMPVT